MTSPFSRDQPGPAPRFRPGPGQVGEHAALQATRAAQRHPAQPGGRQRQQRAERQQRPSGASLGMGTPQPEQPPDQSHLFYGLLHANIQGLGRDVPFGLWALHNGYFPELAPGKTPFDWIE
jgi:hypothetical protein